MFESLQAAEQAGVGELGTVYGCAGNQIIEGGGECVGKPDEDPTGGC